MVRQVTTASVQLWGANIGAVSWDEERALGLFEYAPDFLHSGIALSPFKMPLRPQVYSFPGLNADTFKRLPGMLADTLPDKFGNAMIDQWLVREGINKAHFSPVERLCYIGTRGMGALEFKPTLERQTQTTSTALDLAAMVNVASKILTQRETLNTHWVEGEDWLNEQTLRDILHIGSSAGGARAKAVIAWNKTTNEVRSGQLTLPKGFEHWIIKFDGVGNNKDKELADGQGYGKMEYAYYRMALAAGIDMNECQLLAEHERRHFITKRFDRTASGGKLHMQTLCALEHFDFNMPGAYAYEQAMLTAGNLGLGKSAIEQLYLRALFNIMARNQDDHVKNIAFLMDTRGQWKLAPAYDLTFAYNPQGQFTSQHQMSFNGKRDGFVLEDFYTVAKRFNIPKNRAASLIEQVAVGVGKWEQYATEAEVENERIQSRKRYLKLIHR